MKPRDIARAVITAGWLAGMTLILAALPLWAALAVPGRVTGCRGRVRPLGGGTVVRAAYRGEAEAPAQAGREDRGWP